MENNYLHNKIVLQRVDEGDAVWVTSEGVDDNGCESAVKGIRDEGIQMLAALCEFFGYEPSEMLNLGNVNI